MSNSFSKNRITKLYVLHYQNIVCILLNLPFIWCQRRHLSFFSPIEISGVGSALLLTIQLDGELLEDTNIGN